MTASRGIGRGNGERLRAAPRCGARTRKGTVCAAPRCHGRPRCRMHGGAARSGAPVGNRNALKDGFYTAAERARRRAMNAFIADMNAAVARLEREPVPLTQNRPPPNLSSRIHAGTQSLGSLSRRATGSRHGGRDDGRWLYETGAGGQGQGEGG